MKMIRFIRPSAGRLILQLIIEIVSSLLVFLITWNILIASSLFIILIITVLSVDVGIRFWRITRSGGIINVFKNQMSCEDLIFRRIADSHRVAILAVQAFHIIRPVEGPFFGSMSKRGGIRGAPIRLLLLNPKAHDYVRIRAKEIGEKEDDFVTFINESVVIVDRLRRDYAVDIQVRFYNALPVWQLFVFDDCLFASFYISGVERHRQPVYQIAEGSHLYTSFIRFFNYLWESGVQPT